MYVSIIIVSCAFSDGSGSDCDDAEQDETIDDMEPNNAETESDTELD